jgi:hypothetical protein
MHAAINFVDIDTSCYSVIYIKQSHVSFLIIGEGLPL